MIDPNELMPKINNKVKQLLGEQAMQIAILTAQIEQLSEQIKQLEEASGEVKPNGKDKKHGNLSTQ